MSATCYSGLMHVKAVEACLARLVCHHLFVHECADEPAFSFSTRALERESVPLWRKELDSFCCRDNMYPETISLGSSVFALGTNYDESLAASGVCSIYGLPPSTRAEDVIRDKIALLIDCPEDLVIRLSHMGTFVALRGDGMEKLSTDIDWEACITLSRWYAGEKGFVSSFCRETGGADFVVQRFHGNVVVESEVEEMLTLTGGFLFALVDEKKGNLPPFVKEIVFDDPIQVMREICMMYRRIA